MSEEALHPASRNFPARPQNGKKCERVVRAICAAVAAGVPMRYAAIAGGVSHQTFYVWLREDEKFAERIEEAKAEGTQRRLAKIEAAAEAGDWRAAAWLLEHTQPEHFSKHRIEVHQTGTIEHRHTIPQHLLDEIVKARREREANEHAIDLT
jgi:hypothetical protein